ncbi:MAG TPA: type II toxin-antitoxin system prevent-host-death family antitoxin [Planctomycetota bacterium]|nr:type II toxin-antitoxin system prevent-host-death family antitoxin [Planctomycetota bacterium]
MVTVTFTDLRNHAKKYFDAVQEGETLEVYRHGKPIAVVSPARRPASDYWKRRVAPLAIEGLSLSKEILADREEGR